MDAAATLSFLEDLGDDEVAEFSDSDLEEGSDDDFENEYLYLGQDDDFVPPDKDDAEEDDSESDFHDGAVNRSPLAGRRRGRGRGIVARAAGDGARTPRGRGRGRGRGRAAAGAARGGRGRGRGRGRAAIVVESMWQNADHNPQEKPEFTPLVEAGPNLPADFDGTTELDFSSCILRRNWWIIWCALQMPMLMPILQEHPPMQTVKVTGSLLLRMRCTGF